VLVILALAIGLLVAFRLRRLESLEQPVRTAVFWIVVAVAVAAAYWTTTFDLAETTVKEVPTMLFGLGAIMLAREPRGVLYDMVNRQRLRRLEEAERAEEEAELALEREVVVS
jgi:tellurite resistance protein TehA-like permease